MNLLGFLADNKELLFSGAGVTLVSWIILALRKAIRVRRNRTELTDKNQYLGKIYELYSTATRQDEVLICTSSWPINRSRRRMLRNLSSRSVTFLGPIRTGSKFLGVLWRIGISLERKDRFVFRHREKPGLKFVVVGDHVVLSDSRDETLSETGKFWLDFRDFADMFRAKFKDLNKKSDSLEDKLCELIIQRLETSNSASLKEILDFLTGGHQSPDFPREEQIETLSKFLKRCRQPLLGKGIVYIEVPGQASQIIYSPVTSDTGEVGRELPALRVVLNQECNFRCGYCPRYNENYPAPGKTLDQEQFSYFIKVARSMGFRHYRFTGGEPLKDPDVFQRCVEDNKLDEGVCTISLATNGSLLAQHKVMLEGVKNLRLKVSLDTLDPQRFKKITGVNGDVLHRVLEGLELVAGIHTVGINTVVTRRNECDIEAMVVYCSAHGFYLKLMDLNWYGDLEPPEYYQEHFVPLATFSDRFRHYYEERPVCRTVGGYGIPMSEFQVTDSSFIRIKDHVLGSTYSPLCEACELFPCQEGIYQLTLTCDGKLKTCRHRERDTAIDISQALRRKDDIEVQQAINAQIDRFFTLARFHPRKAPFSAP